MLLINKNFSYFSLLLSRTIYPVLFLCFLLITCQPAVGARAKLEAISRDPYLAALVMDVQSGEILLDDNGSGQVYPASVVKLMDFLIIIELIEKGELLLSELVRVTQGAAGMGGSQVYLDVRESFSVEDLLYALMIHSANDAAVALAEHIAGSKDGFVALMNEKAKSLGMVNTIFYSVHGLPPSKGQKADVTTAEDLALLALQVVRKKSVYIYTSSRERSFRDGKFILRTHNHLLGKVDGVDGLKTGYFRAAGFSIVATAKRHGRRVIAVVMGSHSRKTRDRVAEELIEKGFAMLASAQTVEQRSLPAQ